MRLTPAGECVHRRVERALGQLHSAGLEILKMTGATRHGAAPQERLSTSVTEQMLDALVAIAQGGSECAAAALLRLSQPALNRNLHQLEHLVGATLFMRSCHGTRLTEIGALLLLHAKLALAEIRVAGEELAWMRGRLDGHIVIGALPLSSGHLVPLAVERTLRQHPGLGISIVDGTYETLSHGLRCADVNVIVGALRPEQNEPYATHEALFDDTLIVVVRADHPVLRRSDVHNLRDLADQAWLVPLAGTPSRGAFQQAFRAAGVAPPRIQLEVNSPSIVRGLLLSGDRLALLSPRQVQQELRQGILAVVPVEVTQTRRTIGIATLRSSEPSPGLIALIDSLRMLARPGGAVAYGAAADLAFR
jgi:LysR family transcriptional regulator of gallate degradation